MDLGLQMLRRPPKGFGSDTVRPVCSGNGRLNSRPQPGGTKNCAVVLDNVNAANSRAYNPGAKLINVIQFKY